MAETRKEPTKVTAMSAIAIIASSWLESLCMDMKVWKGEDKKDGRLRTGKRDAARDFCLGSAPIVGFAPHAVKRRSKRMVSYHARLVLG